MNAWWQLWAGKLSPALCQQIIAQALETLPEQTGKVGFGGTAEVSEIRRSKIRWIHHSPEWRYLFDQLDVLFHVANRNAFNFDITWLNEIQFTEYQASVQGHYHWHQDLDWKSPTPTHRKLSLVTQLSSPADYEGGDLELKCVTDESPKADVLRTQGTVVVFPSFTEHRVTPVTKGTRYSLVAWYGGPKFR